MRVRRGDAEPSMRRVGTEVFSRDRYCVPQRRESAFADVSNRETTTSRMRTLHERCGMATVSRNLLKFLLTYLSLPAGGRLRFAGLETAPPFKTGRFARSPSGLSLETETSRQPARTTQAGEIARENGAALSRPVF